MNEFDELKEGLIILDIFKNMTKKLEILENYFYEFIRLSKIKILPIERFQFVLNILGKIFLKDQFDEEIELSQEDIKVREKI